MLVDLLCVYPQSAPGERGEELHPQRPEVTFTQECTRCAGPHGPLRVDIAGSAGPRVSVAYSGRLVVVGVAPDDSSEFGLDVELDTALRRRSVFESTGVEVTGIDGLTSVTRVDAVLKARGVGLRDDYAHTEFEALPIDGPAEGRSGADARAATHWLARGMAVDGSQYEISGFDLILPAESSAAPADVAAHRGEQPGSAEASEAALSVALRASEPR